VTLAVRLVSVDGLPVVGFRGPGGLYVKTKHSGAMLAPLVAEIAAAALLEMRIDNARSALVAP
jgi:glycine/D-amino acid oxidase-like deaminating enzyme